MRVPIVMSARNNLFTFCMLSMTCLTGQYSIAGTIYQWTDESGNINYSDVPPDASVITETREISIDKYDTSDVDLERYSIINQVDQMVQWRRELSEERLLKRRLDLEEKRLAYEMELELERRNEAIAAEEHLPRTYYYAPFRFRHHIPRGINFNKRRYNQQPTNTPSRRNIIPRRYGPVHL